VLYNMCQRWWKAYSVYAGGARGRAPYARNAGGHAACGAVPEVMLHVLEGM
jgi:hypothetical protein